MKDVFDEEISKETRQDITIRSKNK